MKSNNLQKHTCLTCECSQWADVRAEYRVLTGHHENCPRRPDPLAKALDLIAKLVHGMERWAADEEGIHPDAWEAYRQAKALDGELLGPNTESSNPAESR